MRQYFYVVSGVSSLFVTKIVSDELLRNCFFLKMCLAFGPFYDVLLGIKHALKCWVRLIRDNFFLKEFVPIPFPLQKKWFRSMGFLPNVNSIRLPCCGVGFFALFPTFHLEDFAVGKMCTCCQAFLYFRVICPSRQHGQKNSLKRGGRVI